MSEHLRPAVLPLPPKQKRLVHWGCVCLMLSIAMFGLSLATLQEPILRRLDAMDSFSLLSILSILGLAIMTPIGGKLGDLYGRKALVLTAAALSLICAVGMALTEQLLPFLILRLIFGGAQGAFSSAPYILLREINDSASLPSAMGQLASAVAAGGFLGSMIAGVLNDLGLLELAILFPLIPLLLGAALLFFALPKQPPHKAVLDLPGVLALSLGLAATLLALNTAPQRGFTDPLILLGIGVGIASFAVLYKIEQKAKAPLIPLILFSRRAYLVFLALSFALTFYSTAMNYYAPLAVVQLLGLGSSVSGSLQLPRTLICLILPSFCGLWLRKNPQRSWLAMAFAAGLIGGAFLVLGYQSGSLLLYYAMLALTGVAESFRSVSLMPAAQATLDSRDLGIGTALLGFANSLSNLIASLFFGLVYDLSGSVSRGIRGVFFVAAASGGIALLLVLLFLQPRKKA